MLDCLDARTDHHLGGVRSIIENLVARAEARRLDAHRGKCSVAHRVRDEERGARRGGELDRNVDAVGRHPGEQGHDRGRRVRDEPVRATDHAAAGGHRAGVYLVDAQHLERRAGTDDVDDRVNAPDLVEVHL